MNVRMKKFPIVPPWSRGVPPMKITSSSSKLDDRHVKTNATDAGRTCCVLGLIFRGWLKESHFRKASVSLLKLRVGDDWLDKVVTAAFLVARSTAWILSTYHPAADWYERDLHLVVKEARERCADLWPAKFKNPTTHLGTHAPNQAREQGGAVNAKTGKGEGKHRQMAEGAKSLNGTFTVEENMLRVDNVRQSSMFMAHGGYVHLKPEFTPGPDFIRNVGGKFVRRMLSRANTTRTYAGDIWGEDDVAAYAKKKLEGPAGDLDDSRYDSDSDSENQSAVDYDLVPADNYREADVGDILKDPSIWGRLQVPDEKDPEGDTDGAIELFGTLSGHYLQASRPALGCDSSTPPGLRAFASVSLSYRPPYCRDIWAHRYYSVKSAGHEPPAVRVAYIQAIFQFRHKYWVLLTWMDGVRAPMKNVDDATGLPILRQAEASSLRLLTDVLEPQHVFHRCDGTCATSGAGFEDGKHGDHNSFLHNTNFIW
jgi:hypothetical protein